MINLIIEFHLFEEKASFYLFASFTFFEYTLFAYFLFIVITGAFFRKAIIVISCLYIVFLLIYYITAPVKGIDSIPIGIETILLLIFSFYFLYEQMNNTETLFIYHKYSFWIVLGIMMYLSGSFFIYIFANKRHEAVEYWYFTNVFSILKNIFFSISIWAHLKGLKENNFKRINRFLIR